MVDFVVHGIPGSPYVRAVLLMLEERGAAFRFAAIPIGAHKQAEHLARHPFGRIPVLDHGDFRLYETQAILRYLDAVLPGEKLTPAAPREAARMNQLMGIADWYLFQQVAAKIGFQRVVVPLRGGTPDEAVIAAAMPDARICIDTLNGFLDGHAFMVGDALTLADYMLAPVLDMLNGTPEGRGLIAGTQLAGYIDRMVARESMRRTTRERLLAA